MVTNNRGSAAIGNCLPPHHTSIVYRVPMPPFRRKRATRQSCYASCRDALWHDTGLAVISFKLSFHIKILGGQLFAAAPVLVNVLLCFLHAVHILGHCASVTGETFSVSQHANWSAKMTWVLCWAPVLSLVMRKIISYMPIIFVLLLVYKMYI